MKTGSAIGAFCLVAATATMMGSNAGATAPAISVQQGAADATVSTVVLNSTTKSMVKVGGTKGAGGKAYTVEFVVDKDAKISSKKFVLGGMDADESTDPINKIAEAKCAKYVVTVTVQKKNGTAWDKLLETKAHGEWFHSSAPGTIDRCKLKVGWGVAPTVVSKTQTLPAAGADTFRVVVDAGFTEKAWPNNVDGPLVERRKVMANINLVP